MNEHLTPETDAAIDDSPYYQSRFVMVAADFARQLEIQRDEARKFAEEWREHYLKRHVMSQIVSSKLPWEQ